MADFKSVLNKRTKELKEIQSEIVKVYGGKTFPEEYIGQFVSIIDLAFFWETYKGYIKKEGSTWSLFDHTVVIIDPENYTLSTLNRFATSFIMYQMKPKG